MSKWVKGAPFCSERVKDGGPAGGSTPMPLDPVPPLSAKAALPDTCKETWFRLSRASHRVHQSACRVHQSAIGCFLPGARRCANL